MGASVLIRERGYMGGGRAYLRVWMWCLFESVGTWRGGGGGGVYLLESVGVVTYKRVEVGLIIQPMDQTMFSKFIN